MRRAKQQYGWAFALAVNLAAIETAQACAFHGYTPNPTIVDILLLTEQVVIARPAPDNPRRFSAVETLAGPAVSEIQIEVPASASGRRAIGQGETVLLARDGAYGPWLELAALDNRYSQVIRQVMQNQSAWFNGGDAARLALFAAHVNDRNPELRRLALQELDRAPYSALRKLRLPRINNLRADLTKGPDDLTPIRVLLAGLSKDQSFGPLLSSELQTAVARDVPYLGAFATALIELKGRDAVEDIFARYLGRDDISPTAKERLLEAAAIQYRTGSTSTRRVISRQVAKLRRDAPETSDAIARQFGSLRRWQSPSAEEGADR